MRILVNGERDYIKAVLNESPHLSRYLGWLNTPRHNGDFKAYERFFVPLPVAADNSAFLGFDEQRYRRFVAKTPAYIEWITAPDKVANADMTLDLFDRWYPHIQHLPLALVGQDGMEDKELPWSCFDCFFIGGSTRWKLSHAALTLAIEAKQRGKTLHMGRVNSNIRLRYAYDLNCDTVDGTGYSRFSKRLLKPALNYLHKLHLQLTLL